MKLRFSPTSPYVRKVTVMAHETGLHTQITRVPTNPWASDSDLPQDNPLGKIPALITDEGLVLYDSPVICEYLDSLHNNPKLFPSGTERWQVLCQQALGDGILDAAVALVLEYRRRPQPLRWADWQQLQQTTIHRSLDVLESTLSPELPLDIGQITVACTLGYLDFRLGDENWRSGHPVLTEWYESFAERPSMKMTVPCEP